MSGSTAWRPDQWWSMNFDKKCAMFQELVPQSYDVEDGGNSFYFHSLQIQICLKSLSTEIHLEVGEKNVSQGHLQLYVF